MTRDAYLQFTGLTFTNIRIDELSLPTREITEDMLYHMFASGLFYSVQVKRAYENTYREYNQHQMQRYVQERDRLEIRRLQAELANVKAKK
jgi:hypothetical protein